MPDRRRFAALILLALSAVSADGFLMPTKAGQAPLDLRYFKGKGK